MPYDVFISYSRKDTEKAEALCTALDEAGISYWIDRNIHGSANFLSEITAYIKSCKVVVFVASANSANSEWTQKEILYALKHRKNIVPYRIGDFQFEDNDELDFVFTNVQWVESVSAVVESLKKLGCATTSQTPAPQPTPKPQPAPVKTYKVGDYYDDGKKQGVVFEVTADGQHGKIVSPTESSKEIQWSSDKKEQKRLIGADDKYNGASNMAKVQQIEGWREKYPAFARCADLGEGWYLPAIEELREIALNGAIHAAVNRTLATKGTKLTSEWDLYWSSTEDSYQLSSGEFCAWFVDLGYGDTYGYPKYSNYYVCAVSAF